MPEPKMVAARIHRPRAEETGIPVEGRLDRAMREYRHEPAVYFLAKLSSVLLRCTIFLTGRAS